MSVSPYPFYAFYILDQRLHGKERTVSLKQIKEKLGSDQEEDEPSPLFITWNIKDRFEELQLRGCIGTFSALPVDKGISEYSLIA